MSTKCANSYVVKNTIIKTVTRNNWAVVLDNTTMAFELSRILVNKSKGDNCKKSLFISIYINNVLTARTLTQDGYS